MVFGVGGFGVGCDGEATGRDGMSPALVHFSLVVVGRDGMSAAFGFVVLVVGRDGMSAALNFTLLGVGKDGVSLALTHLSRRCFRVRR